MSIVESPYPSVNIPENVDAVEFLLAAADKFGEKPAFICSMTNKTYKFSDLRTVTRRIASGLVEAGVHRGDVVCAILPGCIEVFPLSLGIMTSGAIFTACNPQYTADEIRTHLIDSKSTIVVTHEIFLQKVQKALEDLPQKKKIYVIGEKLHLSFSSAEPFSVLENDVGEMCPTNRVVNVKDDIAMMFYSSGTTGRAKGVMLTHYSMVAQLLIACSLDGLDMGSTTVQFTPVFHLSGYTISLAYILMGHAVVVMPRFDLEVFLKNIEKYRPRGLFIVPPIIMLLANSPDVDKYDLSSVKTIFVGGAPVGPEAENLLQKRLGPIDTRQIYGMTECAPITLTPASVTDKAGSMGVLRPNVIGKVIDLETGVLLGPHQQGELCVKSPFTMKGYWNNPQATKNTIDDEGWLHTGDIVYYDEDKYFYIADRLKELIKYKGFQVPPAELESLLLGHPSVADVCIIGVPDAEAGELPKAYVVLKPGVKETENELVRFVQDRVASYKRLRGGIEFVSTIPKSPSGKILRRIMKDKEKAKLNSKL